MPDRTLNRRAFLGGAMAALAAGRLSLAQSATQPAFDGAAHTLGLFDRISRRFAFKGKTLADFQTWQAAFRPRLRELLGLTHMDREVAFEHRAERAERIARDGYTQEKWYLWTEPDVPLPIWVLIPDRPVAKPYRLVLTPHGHNAPEVYLGLASNDKERQSIAEGERDIAVQAVREGYLCVHPTTRGFGETRRAEDLAKNQLHSCRTGLMHAMLFGRTMIGQRVWDLSRIIDWIGRRHEIDPRCIAVTGNSGGGTTSVFAPACEERITVAVPSSYFCTFRDSIGSIHHCECNYVPGLLREGEMYDVAGLIAPRPFLAIAGKDDRIFPIAGVREAFAKLREIYRAAGAEDRCELFVGPAGHRYYKAGSWPFIRKWFDRQGSA